MKTILLEEKKQIMGLLALWWLMIIFINPVGNFPLNDDWCYAKSVQLLTETGEFKLLNWGEMTLVAHVYWGALFTKLFGFSFTVLRCANLLAASIAIVGTYFLLRAANLTPSRATLATALVAGNPLFVALAFSFMTEISFTTLLIWSTYFFIKALKKDGLKYVIIATIICLIAFLVRQLAFVLPVAWLVTRLLTRPLDRSQLLRAFLPLIISIGFYFTYVWLMQYNGLLQPRFNDRLHVLSSILIHASAKSAVNFLGYTFISLTYLGFFLAPIHWLIIKKQTKRYQFLCLLYGLGLTAVLWATDKLLPCLQNILIDFGIGPVTLLDKYGDFTTGPAPRASILFWLCVTAIGAVSSAAVGIPLKQLWQRRNQPEQNAVALFALSVLIIYLLPFLILGVYDRYLLPLLPFVVLYLARTWRSIPLLRGEWVVAVGFVLLLTTFSVLATHDYLAWNRTRWNVINELLDQGIAKAKIGGGAEYTTWYFYTEHKPKWWENVQPEYELVFQPAAGTKIIKEYEYARWLPGRGTIYLTQVGTRE